MTKDIQALIESGNELDFWILELPGKWERKTNENSKVEYLVCVENNVELKIQQWNFNNSPYSEAGWRWDVRRLDAPYVHTIFGYCRNPYEAVVFIDKALEAIEIVRPGLDELP